MLVATFLSAGAAFLFVVIVGRALGPTEFAPIAVLWTVQYLATTIVYAPMELLIVRRLSSGSDERTPWALYLGVAAVCTAGALAFGIATLDRFFADDPGYVIVLVVLVAGYAGFAIGRGYLAGNRRFRDYAYAITAESVLRLLAAGVLLALSVGGLGLAATMAGAPFAVWLWRPLRGRRGREASRPTEQRATATFGAFVSATAAAQTLLAAGPLVVGGLGGTAAQVSVVNQTLLLLRAPLAVAFNLTSRVLPPLTRFVGSGRWDRLRRLGVLMGIGGGAIAAAVFAAGYFAGPPLVALLMGAEYRPTALLAALAAAGTVLATVALFIQQILVAMKATGRLAVAWLAALACAALTVALTGSLNAMLRVGWAFLVGEVLAFALLVTLVAVARPSTPAREA